MTDILTQDLTFRPITDDDLPFLSRLYASTREEELSLVEWPQEQKRRFLEQQFRAQHEFYQQQFQGARFEVIERGGEPVGRLYVARWKAEIRLIDIAFLPEHRGRGLGGKLLGELIEEARAKGQPLTIHVEKFNPALRLYRRLGFRDVEDKGVYYLMEWRDGETAPLT